MKNHIKFVLIVLFISSVLTQDLILTSDNKIDIFDDDAPVRNIQQAGSSTSGSLRQDTVQIFGGNLGGKSSASGSLRQDTIQIFGGSSGGDSGNFDVFGQRNPTANRAPSSSAAGKASFGEPNAQAMAQRSSQKKAATFSAGPSEAERSLQNARWIYAGGSPKRKAIFMTPCFHNPCPRGEYTLYIQATCQYTVQLVDQNGNLVKTLGSGYAWDAGTIRFTAPCGSHKIKIILSCTCSCPYVCFNLYQDRKNCFQCSKDPLKDLYMNYNPQTCQCECASSCQDCKPPQIWQKFPDCRCVCPRVLVCASNQYFDRRQCRCKCLPNCCPVWPYTTCNSRC